MARRSWHQYGLALMVVTFTAPLPAGAQETRGPLLARGLLPGCGKASERPALGLE